MSHLDSIRKIGFNTSVTVGGRNLHVQTEVLVGDRILIRTMVLEGGAVRQTERLACPDNLESPEEVEAYVRGRHQQHVETLTSSGV